MKKLILLIPVLCVLCLAGCDDAQTQNPATVEATAAWDAPTYGTPVVHYVVQLQEGIEAWGAMGTTTELEMTLELEYFGVYKARVAGVDAEGRQGPWSLPSNPYSPAENQPGVPLNVRFK